MKLIYSLALLFLLGCQSKPAWHGDACFIHGAKCGYVRRDPKTHFITMGFYVIAEQYIYDHINGFGEWPQNEYTDREIRAEVEDYCATQFYYYGVERPNSGSISHVTQAQWEAAQGLYNPHHVKGFMVSGPSTSGTVVTCTGCTITSTATGTMVMSSTGSTKSPCDDTFPPSGDAK